MSKATICKNNERILKLKTEREKCYDKGKKNKGRSYAVNSFFIWIYFETLQTLK